MRTLLDLLPRIRDLGDREALRYHNGHRTWKLSYRQLFQQIEAFAGYFDSRQYRKGDRVLLWGENRAEWVAVFWACVARGVQVVPIDSRSSPGFVQRIQNEVEARLLLAGDDVDSSALAVEQLSFSQVEYLCSLPVAQTAALDKTDISPDDVVEIVYTSGTTGEPKGVVHRHGNICANVGPLGEEIERFRWLARPFQPVRLLNLLPLSHMFGQTAGLFIPPLLGGAVVFTAELSATAVIETIRRERVSVLVSVPRLLAGLQAEITRKARYPAAASRNAGIAGALESWWRHRDVHGRLGWKFWALVVGGARLEGGLEDFWRGLGLVVIQGYGLTETSPVVAMNHPFHTRRGSIGKALAGQEIKIAPDGEILVRGPSVVTDYLGGAPQAQTRFENGWLHTGDLAEVDSEGRLYFRGRKKEMIVTSEGLNVYPQDVEEILHRFREVKDCCVIGATRDGGEQVHAVFLLRDPGADPEVIVRQANRELETHQRIREWSVWPDEDFPRTVSTMKVRRSEVAREILGRERRSREAAVSPGAGSPGVGGVKGVLAQMTRRAATDIRGDLRLDEDLGLSSLDRVELMTQLETQLGIEFDENQFVGILTVQELEATCRRLEGEPPPVAAAPPGAQTARREPSWEGTAESLPPRLTQPAPREAAAPRHAVLPRWTRSAPVRWARTLLLEAAILPMVRELVRLRVEGRSHLDAVESPVIFVANHVSHFDTPVVLAALPWRWRRRVAPAMSQDFFRPYFEPRGLWDEQRWRAMGQYYLACGLFNAYPLPQKLGGTRRALQYTGELIDRGYCPLVFPEGTRSPTGNLQPFKPGIGLMAQRLRVPVVPIFIEGLFKIYSTHQEWPREDGRVGVTIGHPLGFDARQDSGEITRLIEQAIRALGPSRGNTNLVTIP